MNRLVTENNKLRKVSVIVPCYNVGRLIQPLLDSIKKQDYENLEVIFVNDGSTDNTSTILKDFCNQSSTSDHRQYRLVEKVNGGEGSARNAGLDAAEGELVFFVDGDDCLFPQSISKLAELMTDSIDITVGAIINFNGDLLTYPHIENIDRWMRATMTKGALTLVNKMFRKSIIEKYNIRFNTTSKKSVDHLFTAQYLLHTTGGIAVTDYTVYLYQLNPTGISNISTSTRTFSPWAADSVYVAVRIYRLLENKLSPATLKELRYDSYHKYRRIRHEAHVLNCKDQSIYDGMYKEIRNIIPAWEMYVFAIRRRTSIITSSLLRKIHNKYNKQI